MGIIGTFDGQWGTSDVFFALSTFPVSSPVVSGATA